ncbi:MAG: hypothetical protein WBC51_06135, partial [Vicinamibacterales bacterium]
TLSYPGEVRGLQIDVASVITRARRLPKPKVDGVSISLPFLTINVTADDIERKVAQEVLIRLRDKRVLVAGECCDSCIEHALKSIMEIRSILVDKQVKVANEDSAAFVLFDLMLAGIRQFLTFTEQRDPVTHRQEYFAALETLRGHLLRCIEQLANVCGTSLGLSNRLTFDSNWQPQVYRPLIDS